MSRGLNKSTLKVPQGFWRSWRTFWKMLSDHWKYIINLKSWKKLKKKSNFCLILLSDCPALLDSRTFAGIVMTKFWSHIYGTNTSRVNEIILTELPCPRSLYIYQAKYCLGWVDTVLTIWTCWFFFLLHVTQLYKFCWWTCRASWPVIFCWIYHCVWGTSC